MSELRKTVAGLKKSKEILEEELSTVKEAVSRATIKLSPRPQHKSRGGQLVASGQKSSSSSSVTGSGNGNTAQELHTMVERLHLLENERKVKHTYYSAKSPPPAACACLALTKFVSHLKPECIS